jgi:hypothetical protein
MQTEEIAMPTKNWHPTWWNEKEESAWDRVKEALRRDWEQTKFDLHMKGGHELNQNVGDTMNQATGTDPIPARDAPNPPRVIGNWDDVELPIGYGYGARHRYIQEHPTWNDGLERTLRADWEKDRDESRRAWNDVRGWVRHGYEIEGKS